MFVQAIFECFPISSVFAPKTVATPLLVRLHRTEKQKRFFLQSPRCDEGVWWVLFCSVRSIFDSGCYPLESGITEQLTFVAAKRKQRDNSHDLQENKTKMLLTDFTPSNLLQVCWFHFTNGSLLLYSRFWTAFTTRIEDLVRKQGIFWYYSCAWIGNFCNSSKLF